MICLRRQNVNILVALLKFDLSTAWITVLLEVSQTLVLFELYLGDETELR